MFPAEIKENITEKNMTYSDSTLKLNNALERKESLTKDYNSDPDNFSRKNSIFVQNVTNSIERNNSPQNDHKI